jgi:WD40 repeat protein
LSPDARLLAAGGYDAAWEKTGKHTLTIFDLTSGIMRRFGAFDNVLTQIAFSADGRRVGFGLGGNSGIRVLDTGTGGELLADRDYEGPVYGLAFAPDGSLIASSYDGKLRRYGPDLKLTVKRVAPDGGKPFGVAIDPAGNRVALGYVDQTPISFLDAKTLMPLAEAQTNDLANGDLFSVAWSQDGSTLVAGGRARNGKQRDILRRFDPIGRHMGADIAVSDHAIYGVQRCGDGFVFGAQDPLFGVVSAQGVVRILQTPRTIDMAGKQGSAFSISADASSVRFGLGYGEEEPFIFDLAAAALRESPSSPSGLLSAKIGPLPVTDWDGDYTPKFKGTKLALDLREWSMALANRPDASGFGLGTNFWVRAYDAQGNERWKQAEPGFAWGVDFSADGEILVIAYGDGTIRWLRWSDGAELLALFVEPQSRKWVAWTPTGYYMASAGGEDLIGWHVNRGWEQEGDFFPASQFRAEYNRPDIVRLVLKTRDEARAISEANQASDREVPTKPIAANLPPVVTITSPADGSHFSGDSVDVAYSLRSSVGLSIDRLDVLVDGQMIRTIGFEKTAKPRDVLR